MGLPKAKCFVISLRELTIKQVLFKINSSNKVGLKLIYMAVHIISDKFSMEMTGLHFHH